MIVRDFLRWLHTAPAGDRAEATVALARAYLHSPLDEADRAAAEAAMVVLLDDPSPLVREALGTVLASSREAPHAIIHALAYDKGDIAALVLAQSPILGEAELIDAVATGDWRAQCAVACRFDVPLSLAGPIVEIAGADAALALLQNPGAELDEATLVRIAERHGQDADVRNEMLARPDLPAAARHAAVGAVSHALSDFSLACGWMSEGQAKRVASEAGDKATIAIAGLSEEEEMRAFVRHLRKSGRLTTALILRALLSGNIRLVEEALAELSGMPVARVSGIVHARRSAGIEALCVKAGIPKMAVPALRAALDAIHEQGFLLDGREARLSRTMTERVLTALDDQDEACAAQLLVMLRRFAAEATRDEARLIAEDLARDDRVAA